MARRAAVLALLALLAVTARPAPASAQSYSPSISPARVAVEDLLAPGQAHDLPPLAVRNEGDAPIEIVMSVALRQETALPDALDWVTFSPAVFTLAPAETRAVDVAVTVPADVTLGERALWLRATVTPRTDPTGLSLAVGVAVASELVFQVGHPESRAGDDLVAVAGRWSPWLIAPATGAIVYALLSLVGRYRLRVSLERRDSRDGGPGERVDPDHPPP